MKEDYTRYDELADSVRKFHKKHPMVWTLFQRYTFDRINRGFKHYSAYAIFERVRWETDQAQVDGDEFKLNNNHRPFYARAFMKKYPEHEGFFRTRVQTSKEKTATGLPELKPSDFD